MDCKATRSVIADGEFCLCRLLGVSSFLSSFLGVGGCLEWMGVWKIGSLECSGDKVGIAMMDY